jgi:excisionase family DNA binding protein
MPLPDKPLFTVKETAEYLGIPQAQVYQLCRSLVWPRLASVRLGRRIYIPRQAIERWLEEVANQNAQGANLGARYGRSALER